MSKFNHEKKLFNKKNINSPMNILIFATLKFFIYAAHVEPGKEDNVVKVIIPDSLLNDKGRDVSVTVKIDINRKNDLVGEINSPVFQPYNVSNKTTYSSPPDLPPRNNQNDLAVNTYSNINAEGGIYDYLKGDSVPVSSNSSENSTESNMGTLKRIKSKFKKKKPVEDDKADLPK